MYYTNPSRRPVGPGGRRMRYFTLGYKQNKGPEAFILPHAKPHGLRDRGFFILITSRLDSRAEGRSFLSYLTLGHKGKGTGVFYPTSCWASWVVRTEGKTGGCCPISRRASRAKRPEVFILPHTGPRGPSTRRASRVEGPEVFILPRTGPHGMRDRSFISYLTLGLAG